MQQINQSNQSLASEQTPCKLFTSPHGDLYLELPDEYCDRQYLKREAYIIFTSNPLRDNYHADYLINEVCDRSLKKILINSIYESVETDVPTEFLDSIVCLYAPLGLSVRKDASLTITISQIVVNY